MAKAKVVMSLQQYNVRNATANLIESIRKYLRVGLGISNFERSYSRPKTYRFSAFATFEFNNKNIEIEVAELKEHNELIVQINFENDTDENNNILVRRAFWNVWKPVYESFKALIRTVRFE